MKTNLFSRKLTKKEIIYTCISVVIFILWVWICFFFGKDEDVLFSIGKVSLSPLNWFGLLSLPGILFALGAILDDAFNDRFEGALVVLGVFLFFLIFITTTLICALTFCFSNIHVLTYVFYGLIAVSIISVCVTIISILRKSYRLILYSRIIMIASFSLFLLFLALACILYIILFCCNPDNDSYGLGMIHGISTMMILALIIELFPLFKETHYFIFWKKDYLLYLRSFVYDENEDSFLDYIESKIEDHMPDMTILSIGNPETLIPTGLGERFYLPTTNWKKELDYYISRAKLVLCVIDYSDGVLWEMFEHLNEMEKYFYYISDKDKINTICEKIKASRYSDSVLAECFNNLQKVSIKGPVAFIVRDGKCFYDNPHKLLSAFLGLPYIKLDDFQSFEVNRGVAQESTTKVQQIKNKKTKWKSIGCYFRDMTRTIINFFVIVVTFIAGIFIELYEFFESLINSRFFEVLVSIILILGGTVMCICEILLFIIGFFWWWGLLILALGFWCLYKGIEFLKKK